MTVEESGRWDISVCGLNCARCQIYQAYKNKDVILQLRISKSIFGEDADHKPEGITCDGCRGDLDVHWSPGCEFKPCADERGHRYCFECDDFPCEKLEEFASDGIPYHERTVENMKRMKEFGIEAWIMEQRRRGQCLFCP